MKVAILSESSADEAAIRILVDGILGAETQAVALPRLRTRGWTVINVLPAIIKGLYYQSDAEALAFVIDSDDSPVHQPSHDITGGEDPECRLCRVRSIVELEQSRLPILPNRGRINVAVGLAVPSIEAWYRCGIDPQVSEATWSRRLQSSGAGVYTRRTLKKDVYGTERPPLALETTHAIQAARRLAGDLTPLEQLFPGGFGSLLWGVRSW